MKAGMSTAMGHTCWSGSLPLHHSPLGRTITVVPRMNNSECNENQNLTFIVRPAGEAHHGPRAGICFFKTMPLLRIHSKIEI
jgi:hypothetical protein